VALLVDCLLPEYAKDLASVECRAMSAEFPGSFFGVFKTKLCDVVYGERGYTA